MSSRKSRRKAWSTLLLSATFSASLLSFAGTSDGQQTTNPQQTLQTTLQRQQQELEQLLKQHEIQRESLNRKIQSTAATLPVNHQAIEGLHRQMTEIHKRQDKEKQSLAKRHLQESNSLRSGINPGGQPTEAEQELDENENGEVEFETSASLRLTDGLDIRDANGVIISGEAELLVTGASFDAEILIAGLLEANQVSAVEIRDTVTGDVYATLNGNVLTAITEAAPFVEPEENALAEASPEWAGALTGQDVTEKFLDALKKNNLEVIVKSAAHPEGFLKGAFGQLDLEALKEFVLDKSSLPVPVVVDRSFTKLGTVNEIVIQDETAAIQLGKALFWDVQVGADNKTACATCHNFGGADWRTKNQLASGGNRELTLADFVENDGRLNDIVGSQGVVQENHVGVNPPGKDLGEAPTVQELVGKFTLNGTVESRTRQVAHRNAPTVINAAFYARQFWDGRANRFFNGENIFGTQDPDAGVWENNNGVVRKNTNFLIDYSSLASQAVGPVGSSMEMAHGPNGARSLPELGKKMLDGSIRPLGLQKVHASDSVLASLVAANGVGLNKSYAELIRQAFKPQFWNYAGGEVAGQTQMEANFALFFGLAVQAYERTLISDQSRFDKFVRGEETQLTFDEKEGFN
ncbi:MAG: cytochrome-c peroxidase, partial [Fuerstiella sp.]